MLAGCKDKPALATAQAADASEPAVVEAWTLTVNRLDGYLRYQRALLGQAGVDAGAIDPSVEARADLDERARQQAGLSVDDVERIESMVSSLASRRLASRMTGADQPLPLPPQEKDKPSPEQAEQLAHSIASRQALLKASTSLQDERTRFGSQNIDVLLQREAELLKNWALLMGLPEDK